MEQYLEYFYQISQIPHGSGNTKEISDFVMSFAKEQNLKYRQDAANNIIIIKGASEGFQDHPGVILQGHLDMVAVKEPEIAFDFTKDPLQLTTEGDFLKAKGTSLGADNGIAAAMMLAVLADDSLCHPRLECVFTTDEEIGMLGADAMDMSDLESRYMLNLDSDEEGQFVISCAGGARCRIHLPVSWQQMKGKRMRLELTGLTGGHSGMEINKNRGNGILLIGELLRKLQARQPLCIAELHGGFADNVIPSSCCVTLVAAPEEGWEPLLMQLSKEILSVYQETEPEISLQWYWKQSAAETACVEPEVSGRLLWLLENIPNGVQAMSSEIPGMVETSANLGTIRLTKAGFELVTAPRSALDEANEQLIRAITGLTEEAGGEIHITGEYPGWPVVKDSLLQKIVTEAYEELTGEKAVVKAIHAGLECGIFSRRIPGLEIISFGPNLYDIHSAKERMSLSSAERTWQLLIEILKRI